MDILQKKRFLDIFLLNYNKLKNIKLWIILIVFFAAVTLFSVLLSLFIIYEEKLGLKSAIHYINAFLNIYSVFGIYINVGFFIVQVTKDFSRQKNAYLSKRYCLYSKTKVIKETEKYVSEINHIYFEFHKILPLIEKNKNSPYCQFLLEIYEDSKKKLKLFKNYPNKIKYLNYMKENKKN